MDRALSDGDSPRGGAHFASDALGFRGPRLSSEYLQGQVMLIQPMGSVELEGLLDGPIGGALAYEAAVVEGREGVFLAGNHIFVPLRECAVGDRLLRVSSWMAWVEEPSGAH